MREDVHFENLQRSPSTTSIYKTSEQNILSMDTLEIPLLDRGIMASNLRRSKEPRPQDPNWLKNAVEVDGVTKFLPVEDPIIIESISPTRDLPTSRNQGDLTKEVIKGVNCQPSGSFNQVLRDNMNKVQKETSKK